MDDSRLKFRVWDDSVKDYIKEKTFLRSDGCIGFQTYTDAEFQEVCIVEMSTGLKDKNGKLIYEGDVLKAPDTLNEKRKLEVVREDGGEFRIYYNYGFLDYIRICSDTANDLEIIGSIHEEEID